MTSDFQSLRAVRRFCHQIDAEPERIFPLLCPEREHDWIDGWNARIVYSASGLAELDCTFVTQLAGKPDRLWTVSLYDPQAFRIEFVVTHGDLAIERLSVAVQTATDGTSTVEWIRTYTGLNPEGNAFIETFTGEPLDTVMDFVGQSLRHFLTTGEMLAAGSH